MSSRPSPLEPPGRYYAYLVRLWQEHPQGPWRASLQSAQTGERLVFATLESLYMFLQAQTDTVAVSDEQDPSP